MYVKRHAVSVGQKLLESINEGLVLKGIKPDKDRSEYLVTLERDCELLVEVCEILKVDTFQIKDTVRSLQKEARTYEKTVMLTKTFAHREEKVDRNECYRGRHIRLGRDRSTIRLSGQRIRSRRRLERKQVRTLTCS